MSTQIILLGTGTCQLQENRRASSVLVELDGLRLVYDLGRGIADRLAALGLRQDDVEHVVLSHFHPDHVSDLIPYLQAAAWSRIDARTRDLHVHGPKGLKVQMMRLLSLFGPDDLARDHYQVHLHEERGDRLTVAGHTFEYADLPPAGNRGLGFTVGSQRVVLTGDSHFHEQEVEFLRGADLAVIDSGHLDDEEIVELAARSGAARIVCSHVYRELDAEELTARAGKRGYAGEIVLAHDRMRFEF